MSFSMTRLSVAGAVVSAEVRHLGVITNGRGLQPSGYGDAQVLRWGLTPQGGGRVWRCSS